MAYIIAEPCINVKDRSCVKVSRGGAAWLVLMHRPRMNVAYYETFAPARLMQPI
jgi:hypothetical protein